MYGCVHTFISGRLSLERIYISVKHTWGVLKTSWIQIGHIGEYIYTYFEV